MLMSPSVLGRGRFFLFIWKHKLRFRHFAQFLTFLFVHISKILSPEYRNREFIRFLLDIFNAFR